LLHHKLILYIITIMNNKKHPHKILLFIILLILYVPNIQSQEEKSTDPVLDFYLDRAKAVYKSYNPVETGAVYSFISRSYQSELKRNGIIELTDSSIVKYFFSFGNLDSHKVEISTIERLDSIDFSYPNLFEKDYDFNFFPHDIGGDNISIGIDSDTTKNLEPVGIVVIDRQNYVLRRLYLYYPDEDKYKRYSKVISFNEHEGVVFPDSINVTYSEMGIFNSAHYRLLTVIDSFSVTH
jgi:hypothetical protein